MNKNSKDLNNSDTLNHDENKVYLGGVFEKEDIVLFNLNESKDYEDDEDNEESDETHAYG